MSQKVVTKSPKLGIGNDETCYVPSLDDLEEIRNSLNDLRNDVQKIKDDVPNCYHEQNQRIHFLFHELKNDLSEKWFYALLALLKQETSRYEKVSVQNNREINKIYNNAIEIEDNIKKQIEDGREV